ncbi:hypothetical protein Zm00014a_000323 [Zea mays]|uniref:Uncharacterized protein n=1 Tax=Zea mays TaxID=4577 RepID=A0A3L6FXY6_MAIZE|nr:hypothetical protein Zm00014a_000323 [Zea mays]
MGGCVLAGSPSRHRRMWIAGLSPRLVLRRRGVAVAVRPPPPPPRRRRSATCSTGSGSGPAPAASTRSTTPATARSSTSASAALRTADPTRPTPSGAGRCRAAISPVAQVLGVPFSNSSLDPLPAMSTHQGFHGSVTYVSLKNVYKEGKMFCPGYNLVVFFHGNYNLDAYFSALNELTFFNCLPQLVQMDLANQISFMEGAGHSVVSAFVEIVFDNSDNRIPLRALLVHVWKLTASLQFQMSVLSLGGVKSVNLFVVMNGLRAMVAEEERELEEGEAQKSPSKIVADSLSQISRSSTFLPNIGVRTTSKTGRSTSLAAQARMQAQFEEKLQDEREEAARKQEELQAQLQAQQAALEENQSLLRQTQEEVKGMHTKFEETNALLRAVLKLQKD